jgi:small-conductance mechanosensitive channel
LDKRKIAQREREGKVWMAPMKEEYVPNEKYRNMFGVERSGYGCERVDLYLAQLEVAFKKIREDNRALKRDLAGQAMGAQPGQAPQGFSLFPPDSEMAAQLEQQGQYIMQLQAQLAEQQELGRRQAGQRAQVSQMQQRAADPQVNEALMAQLAALRGEADALRQQLRQQAAPAPVYQISEEEQQGLIGKVLVEARAQAGGVVRAARQESETMMRRARQTVDELKAEQERVHSQLQGISYGLRNILRESAGAEYQQRGEEFAAS